MPYSIKNLTIDNSPKFKIRFRGTAMIPRINCLAPCKMDLTFNQIETVLESLHRRPLRIEVFYVDPNNREWEINYTNYRKIIPLKPRNVSSDPKIDSKVETPKQEAKPHHTPSTKVEITPVPVATGEPVITEIPVANPEDVAISELPFIAESSDETVTDEEAEIMKEIEAEEAAAKQQQSSNPNHGNKHNRHR